MKKLSLLLGIALAGAAAMADDNASWVRFSSTGPDKYADGTTVLNDEVYALVWVKEGAKFDGILATGELVNPADNKIVAQAALADNGACPPVCYIISGENLDLVGKGDFFVYVLDTRVKSDDGTEAAGVKDKTTGKFVSYNGYEKVDASVTVQERTVAVEGAASGNAAVQSALPAGVPQPKVEKIDVTGDQVVVKVSNTVPYVKYAITAGENIGKIDNNLANGVNGVEGDVITLVVENPDKYRFFKVERSK